MKALVTGGTGFVGSHLIERLRAGGDEVVALCRPTGDRRFLESLGAKVSIGDIEDPSSLGAACTGCDVVYHAAARVDFIGTWEQFRRTTIEGTRNVHAAAMRAGVRRFVLVSSCGVYHPSLMERGMTIDESTQSPDPPKWFHYAVAKHQAEQAVRRETPADREWVLVRLGYVYGPRNRSMRAYVEPLMRDGDMAIVGNGENPLAFVYVEDAAEAIARAGLSERAAGRVLIAVGSEHVTQRQYVDALADGFGLPRVTRQVPYHVAYAFGWLGEFLFKRGPKAMAMRRCSIALTGLPQRIRGDQTQALLEWKPQTPFAEGMRATFEWYRTQYKS